MRQTKGFSLIELMIALGIVTILATIAVPRVQVWNARNRGLQLIMEIVSDFSKAKLIAVSTVVKNDGGSEGKIEVPSGNGSNTVNLGTRPQVAMVFWSDGYKILQKASLNSNWENAESLRTQKLLDYVHIATFADSNINENIVMSKGFSNAKSIVFTSTGFVKNQDGGMIEPKPSSDYECGDVDTKLASIFSAVVKAKISGTTDAICYRGIVDQAGRYNICMTFAQGGADCDFSKGSVVEM
ncbi:pilin [bacterium]|nr:pilin [bacterium]